jgi:hypothetical protein
MLHILSTWCLSRTFTKIRAQSIVISEARRYRVMNSQYVTEFPNTDIDEIVTVTGRLKARPSGYPLILRRDLMWFDEKIDKRFRDVVYKAYGLKKKGASKWPQRRP